MSGCRVNKLEVTARSTMWGPPHSRCNIFVLSAGEIWYKNGTNWFSNCKKSVPALSLTVHFIMQHHPSPCFTNRSLYFYQAHPERHKSVSHSMKRTLSNISSNWGWDFYKDRIHSLRNKKKRSNIAQRKNPHCHKTVYCIYTGHCGL